MNARLQLLIKEKGLTSARFAEILGIQPSAVSHLISGRNKPGFEIISKILVSFPEINPRWLILGEKPVNIDTPITEGEISSSQTNGQPTFPEYELPGHNKPPESRKLTLFEIERQEIVSENSAVTEPGASNDIADTNIESEAPLAHSSVPGLPANQKEVEKVLVLYRDGTFDIYVSNK